MTPNAKHLDELEHLLQSSLIPAEERLKRALKYLPGWAVDLWGADCALRALVRERAAGREPHEEAWRAVEVIKNISLGANVAFRPYVRGDSPHDRPGEVPAEHARIEAEALAFANVRRERREMTEGDEAGEKRTLAASAAWLSIHRDPWEASVAAAGNAESEEQELRDQVARLLGMIQWARKEKRLAS